MEVEHYGRFGILKPVALGLVLVAGILLGPDAVAVPAGPELVVGDWAGPSYDQTWDVHGEAHATFWAMSPSTFSGTLHAVYEDPDVNPAETCTISSGHVSATGAVSMNGQCRSTEHPYVVAAVVDAQLDSSGTVMTGTFRGAGNDVGSFTLNKIL